MPELPEVETIRLQLATQIPGKSIETIEVRNPKSVIGKVSYACGRKVTGLGRIGKMLVIEAGKECRLGIHLKMSGQIILEDRRWKIEDRINANHIRAIIHFADKTKLYFVDQRKFGWLRVFTKNELRSTNYVKRLGKEPWDITDDELYVRLQRTSRSIKSVILDQTVLSGAGNIYANDALWIAGILPTRSAKSLSRDDNKTLRKALIDVLNEGIVYGGSTGKDRKYIHVNGESGKYQNHFKVYEREGKPCLHGDGGIIKKISLGGRGTYYCPDCQK